MSSSFKINRRDLSRFLPDDRTIREFEKMLESVSTLDDISYTAKVSKVTSNTALDQESISILADASGGAISITLPSPSQSYASGRSYQIGITKADLSTNIVTILPYASEKVVGSSSETLEEYGEVLNFITDGIDWHLLN